MFEKLQIFISLIAGIIYTFYALTKEWDFFFWLKNVIIVLVLFYILGMIMKSYFKKILKPKDAEKADVEVSLEEVSDDAEQNEEKEHTEEVSSDDERRRRRRFDFNRDDDETSEEDN